MPRPAPLQRPLVVVRRAALLGAVWLVLVGGDVGGAAGLGVGALAVVAATVLSVRLLPPRGAALRLWPLVRIAPGFVWRSVLGGVDVARRALHPRLPLRPGWVVLPTSLPPGGPRVALGGEFSLLPGTLVAGTRGDALLVHCLDRGHDVAGEVARAERELAACVGDGAADAAPRRDTGTGR